MQSENITTKNEKNENIKKTFIIKKLKKMNNDLFKKELYDLFNNPNTYLSDPKEFNSKCIVGKKATGPKYDENNNLIAFSVVGRTYLFDKKKKKKYGHWIRSFSKSREGTGIFSENSLLNVKPNKEKKVETISKLFEFNEKLIKENKNKENSYLKKVPNELKIKLKRQENTVKLHKSYEIENSKIIENIKKDYNKRNAFKKPRYDRNKPLLIETSNLSLMKNEANTYSTNLSNINQDLAEQNNWLIGLRRPNNFLGKRDAYIPYGRRDNIKWAILNESFRLKNETIADPSWKKDELLHNTKSNFFNSYNKNLSIDESAYRTSRTISRFNNYQNKAKKLADLEIKGESLFKLEKEHFLSLNGNFNYFLPKTAENNDDCLKDITIIESYKDKKCKYKPFYCKTAYK